MNRNSTKILAVSVAVLVVGGLVTYYEISLYDASTGFVTGSAAGTTTNVYASCTITGIGGIELRVLSDIVAFPVNGEKVNAVGKLGCVGGTADNGIGHATITTSSATILTAAQVVHINNFSAGPGGWLTPIFPAGAVPAGQLNFTVAYQGKTYNFSELVPPIGTSCVTLYVPSGSVSSTVVMNNSGSDCS
jgi:hypothetical protein